MLFTRNLIRHASPLRHFNNKCSFARFLGSAAPKKDDESALVSFGDATARGTGQVLFLNSPKAGMAILGSLALGDPYLAALAAVGTVAATGAAQVLGGEALRHGLYGYNGCLVGCATAVFIAPLSMMSGLVTTVVAGAATPFVAAALKSAMGSVPQWTFSFNVVTLTMLLRLQPFEGATQLAPYEGSLLNLAISAPLKGVSQIFVVESNLTGAALLGSMALLYSPGLAAHTLMGASVGALTGAALGAELASLEMGLWGFNSALTSLGVGVFFVHSKKTVAVSAGGAVATAALFGAFQQVFQAWYTPCLTLPFCIAMSGCYLLQMPGLRLAKNPHSPEKNE